VKRPGHGGDHDRRPRPAVFTIPVTGLTPGTACSFKAFAADSFGPEPAAPVGSFATSGDNSNLSSLHLERGALAPLYNSAITTYTTTVTGTSLALTPTVAQGNAAIQVRVNGGTYATVASGSASASLPLNARGGTPSRSW